MRFVYVLEDEVRFQKEIADAIAAIDPKIQVRFFLKLQNFAEWLKLMMTQGPSAISQGGTVPQGILQQPISEEAHQLVAVISKVEFLGSEQLGLLKRTRDLFIQRKICTVEDPTAFVLMAFDKPDFKKEELEDRILNNIIFKPFDKLILIQHLTFAIDGRHPPSKYTITNQKTTSVIEMLKAVQIEELSDIGFTTVSDRQISIGAAAKYYSTHFLSERQKSVIAVCRSCEKHPHFKDLFRCELHYFSNDPTQITNIRKKTRHPGATQFSSIKSQTAGPPAEGLNFIMIDEDEDQLGGLLTHIKKRFGGVQVLYYKNFADFYAEFDPKSAWEQRDKSVKAFQSQGVVTLNFNSAGNTFLGTQGADGKPTSPVVFGTTEAELKNKGNWLQQALDLKGKELLRQILTNSVPPATGDCILEVRMNQHLFLIKVVGSKKDAQRFQMDVVELTKDESIQHLRKNSKLPQKVDLLLVSHKFFGEQGKERWSAIIQEYEKASGFKPKLIMLSKQNFSDAEERAFADYCTDIFFKPVDRVYFNQKMHSLFPKIHFIGEDVEIKNIKLQDTIKVASPVQISEISEAGLIMEYYRKINLGSFREFILWQPYEVGAPELLAQVNYVEEIPGNPPKFNIHMVFFGATDHFLKAIRVWVRDNYVLSKEKGS
ncbi:MAG: hypothetical protein LW875_02860 [Proteobacteria bacterium]|nr:hypothetical protein [Pseudomonadota bacterium]